VRSRGTPAGDLQGMGGIGLDLESHGSTEDVDLGGDRLSVAADVDAPAVLAGPHVGAELGGEQVGDPGGAGGLELVAARPALVCSPCGDSLAPIAVEESLGARWPGHRHRNRTQIGPGVGYGSDHR
jgi:hypothetical protein